MQNMFEPKLTLKRVYILPILCFLLLFSASPALSFEETGALEGDWEGFIGVPGTKIPIILHLYSLDESLTGAMDIPAQGAFGLELNEILADGSSLNFKIPVLAGSFEGGFDRQAGTISGTWSQGGGSFLMTFSRVEGEVTAPPARPQTPSETDDYISENLTFPSREEGITLGGTLTRPKGAEKAPAFILLSGSGTQERDHTVMGHKTFLVLANYLTRNGYAVLRIDDRGIGESNGNPNLAGLKNLTQDALGAWDLLASNPAIDADKIGLIGISQGGMIAVNTGLEEPRISSLILLSSPLQGYKETIPIQVKALNIAAGASEQTAEANANLQRQIMEMLISEPTPEAGGEKVKTFLASLGMPETEVEKQVSVMITPAYYSFIGHNPAADLEKSKAPVLAIYGSKDLQVSAIGNIKIIENLSEGGRENITTFTFENLNHLLQTAETGMVKEYATIEETMAPKVLETILNWLKNDIS